MCVCSEAIEAEPPACIQGCRRSKSSQNKTSASFPDNEQHCGEAPENALPGSHFAGVERDSGSLFGDRVGRIAQRMGESSASVPRSNSMDKVDQRPEQSPRSISRLSTMRTSGERRDGVDRVQRVL